MISASSADKSMYLLSFIRDRESIRDSAMQKFNHLANWQPQLTSKPHFRLRSKLTKISSPFEATQK
jgi:hypothetical protein